MFFRSKTSTSTVRSRPVPDLTSASGAFRVDAETFTIESSHRIEVIDVTDRLMAMVRLNRFGFFFSLFSFTGLLSFL